VIIGYHAPPPGAKTGVADYAAALLAALRQRGRVDWAPSQADVHLYHLGNNQLHRGIYETAMRQPGVVVLHDAVLHHFYLGAFSRERYLAEYVYNYGPWESDLAQELWLARAGSGMDVRYFAKPMLKQVGERSLAVIVHNSAAAEAVRSHAPEARIVEIPHLFELPALPIEDSGAVRARLGIGEEAFVFGVFGYLRESKRILPILQCFDRVHRLLPRARLLLAGSFASPDLERAVKPWLAHPGVVHLPHLSERDFWGVTNAVDCCLNLRHPGAGETSGIGVRLMGLGKTVVFTDGLEIAALPADACVRVSPGLEESAQLFEYMKMLMALPELVRGIGERAAKHVRYHHSLDRVADRFRETICDMRPISR
jgi:glycosyltransferase involved in cell wall biosynthesis